VWVMGRNVQGGNQFGVPVEKDWRCPVFVAFDWNKGFFSVVYRSIEQVYLQFGYRSNPR